jgi:hypothetical protein
VRISRKGSAESINVSWKHLFGLIENILRIQREGEEG